MPVLGCTTRLVALSILLIGCGRDHTTGRSGPATTTGDDAVVAGPDLSEPDLVEPAPGEDVTDETDALPSDPYPQSWITPPPDWCEKTEHQAIVKWTFDGDTIELNDGARVRLIGVDAPELTDDECWSHEATDLLRSLTFDGAVVCLREDITSSPVDPYGRLLRYVFIKHAPGEWGMVNARLVRLGAAPAYHSFLKGKVYEEEFELAEEEAYADRLGGWASCNW